MRAAVYVRVSTREQSLEGYSIAAQKERCSKFIESQEDWELAKIYADPGYSAKNLERPAMQELLKDLELDAFDVIVVYRLDRMVRSVLDLHQLLGKFEKNNVKFKSVTEVFDTTTAMGKFFITMVGAMAEWERNNLSERVSMGMEQMAKEGKWSGGYIGYGHEMIDGKFEIIEEEASIIRDMFDMYIKEGLGDGKIAIKLNEAGIATRENRLWTDSKINRILKNKKNIGSLEFRKGKESYVEREGIYPPIIDEITYHTMLKIRDARLNNMGKGATSDYYFSRISRCSRCGSHIKGNSTRQKGVKYKFYLCKNKLIKRCDMPTFSEKYIESQFIKVIRDMVIDNDSAWNDLKPNNVDKEKEIKKLNNDIKKIRARRKKWQYAWASEKIEDKDFEERMKEEKYKEDSLLKSLGEIGDIGNNKIDESIKPIVLNTIANWHNLSDSEKKQLLQIIIHEIVIDIDENKKGEDRVIIKSITFN